MNQIVLQALLAGLGTCLGTLMVIVLGRLRPGALSLLLGLASGIMAAVIVLNLFPAALRYGGPGLSLAGFLAGVALVAAFGLALNRAAPGGSKGRSYRRMGYLIAAGIALHDLPEGLAIAAGFAAADKLGPLLVLAIGLHNIPEGMVFAAPLRFAGFSAGRVLAISLAISLVTPLGAILGMALIDVSAAFIGLLLALAAGAMFYIVLGELVPESNRGNRPLAYSGMLAGMLMIISLKFIV